MVLTVGFASDGLQRFQLKLDDTSTKGVRLRSTMQNHAMQGGLACGKVSVGVTAVRVLSGNARNRKTSKPSSASSFLPEPCCIS